MGNCSRFIVLMASACAAAFSAPAFAQTQDPAAAASAAGEEEAIVVTGSRIARTTFQTPTPVTAIGEEQLEAKAATSVIELLRDIPALQPNKTVGGGRSLGVSNFNLRSLGAQRTLTLLDGERLLASSPVGGFDLNVIPAPLLSRVEVATAGASSVYGSDAVSGVVNIMLNSNLDGGRLDVQYQETQRGDGETFSAAGAYGAGFAADRGHFVIGASFVDKPDIFYQGARDWGQQGWTLIPNSAFTPTNDEPAQIIVPNARLSQMTLGGVITTAGPLRNIQFGPNGAQSMFNQGTNVGGIWMIGGDGLLTQPDFGVLDTAARQESLFSRVSYDFTPELRGRVDVLATRSRNDSTNNYNYNNGDIVVRQDNAFLPTNIRDAMIANNLQTIRIGRLNPELGINTNRSRNRYYRLGTGLEGALWAGWEWDVGASYTYAEAENTGAFNRIQANWTAALDSVIGPGGQPVCRSTLSNPTNGCVPANIFGLNSLSTAVVDYVTGTSWQRSYSRSVDVFANFTGELGATWAGPIGAAFGVEYREDTVNSKSDPISDVSGWRQGTFASFAGEVTVSEFYVEASVPLLAGLPLAERVDLDVAARYVDYSTSGATEVWKLGLNWEMSDAVRLRGTYSKDFRAPTINDLYATGSLRAGNPVLDYNPDGTRFSVNVNTLTGGNPNLDPEVSHTVTAGIVLQPNWFGGLQLSADYFSIELEDALAAATAQQVVDFCFEGDQTFCSAIDRNAQGQITLIHVTSFNTDVLKTSGVDLEASVHFPLGDFNPAWGGELGLSAVATYVESLETTTAGGTVTDTAGQLTGALAAPHWRSSGSVTYNNGPFNARLLVTYVGEGTYDNRWGPKDININNYPSYTYSDLTVQYDLTEHLQIYGKVQNLFDTDPPLLASPTITVAPATLSPFHDTLGRNFGIGARYRW